MRKVFENVLDYNDFKIKVKQEIRKGETNNERLREDMQESLILM